MYRSFLATVVVRIYGLFINDGSSDGWLDGRADGDEYSDAVMDGLNNRYRDPRKLASSGIATSCFSRMLNCS